MRDLSIKYQIKYLELKDGLIPSEYWFDHCHLNPKGESIKANFIFDGLKDQIDYIISKRLQ